MCLLSMRERTVDARRLHRRRKRLRRNLHSRRQSERLGNTTSFLLPFSSVVFTLLLVG